MEVYFMRHGETPWNREKRIQGSTGWIDLSDYGVQLAERTRDGMIAEGLSFDRIFASPLRRAMHTAEIIGNGFGVSPEADSRITEMDFGRYEGTVMTDEGFVDSNIRSCFRNPPAFVPDGGESFDDLLVRAKNFFEETLFPLEGKVKRVLAVSHGAFMRTVIRYVTGRSLKDYWQGTQPNCCVHIIEITGGKVTLKEMSKSFL